MKVVDCFCGLGPWRQRDPLLPWRVEETVSLMDHFGIDRALAYGNQAADSGYYPDANRVVSEAATRNDRFIPAFAIGPHAYDDAPGLDDYVAAMRAASAKAVWLRLPNTRPLVSFRPWLVGDILAMCAHKQLPALIHTEGMAPDDLHALCSDFPELRIILTGIGYNCDWWLYPLLRRHAGLFVCLAHLYIPPGGPMRFVRHIGADRLIFGSGLPHFSPGGLIGHVMYAELSDADKELILSGNLLRLLAEVQL